jgi:hypothetical protein
MAPSNIQKTCTGRTCLKWSADGSLAEHDHRALMERLYSADPALAQTEACALFKPSVVRRRAPHDLTWLKALVRAH